jgi:ATP-dependent DNA helicase RecG
MAEEGDFAIELDEPRQFLAHTISFSKRLNPSIAGNGGTRRASWLAARRCLGACGDERPRRLPRGARPTSIEEQGVRMFLRELGQSITVLKGAGVQVAAHMAKLGVYTVADLILYYPRDYDDRTHFIPLASFAREARVRSLVDVVSHEWFGYGRMRTLKVTVRDESASAVLVCFNRPFLENQLPVGSRVVVTGKFAHRYGELQSSTFEIESLGPGGVPSSGILPVYPLTEGINQGQLRRIVKAALVEYASKVEEEMPAALRARKALMPKREALRAVHFPKNPDELAAARMSLIFEELFYFQIAVARRAMRRSEIQVERKAPRAS